MQVAWNGETMPALALSDELTVVGSAGYDGLELFIPKLKPFLESHSAEDLARLLQRQKLHAVAFNGIENFSLRPPAEFAQIEKDCGWLAQLSKVIGCPCIVVIPSPRPEGISWAAVKEGTADALRRLAGVAAPFGVKLAFEFLAPANCSVRTLAQGWEIVQATGCENTGLVLDTYHFFVGGSSWKSLEEFDIDRLFLVHLNDVDDLPLENLTDGDRLLPGEGILPLGRILTSLKARGYNGAYSLEVMRPAYRTRDPLEYARAGKAAIERVLQ